MKNITIKIKSLTIKDKDNLEDIYDTLEMKLDSLECSEPDSCGETHDIWEEKCDDLDNLVDRLEDYQLEYTGLVRLRF